MKAKLLLFSAIIVSFVVLFASCNKDTPTPPAPDPASMTFDPDTTDTFTGLPGDSWSFTVTATAPSGFDSLYVEKKVGDGDAVLFKSIKDNTDNSATYNFSYTLVQEEVGKTITFTFTLVETGTSGVSATKTIVTNSPPARSYTTILLYAPLTSKEGKGFFSTNTGAVYSPDSVNSTDQPLSADIDFGYYYGAANHASLASPYGYSLLSDPGFTAQVAGWGTLNHITFRKTTLTASQFNELSTFADIDGAFEAGTNIDNPNVITGLAADQVIAFATAETKAGGSKKGLIHVSEISGSFNSGDYIKLDIIVEEPAE